MQVQNNAVLPHHLIRRKLTLHPLPQPLINHPFSRNMSFPRLGRISLSEESSQSSRFDPE